MAIDQTQLARALDMVRPLILGHGGDISVIEDDQRPGVVQVRLEGACRACPNIAMTFVGPVRTALLAVDGIAEVQCRQVRSSPRTLARLATILGAAPIETSL